MLKNGLYLSFPHYFYLGTREFYVGTGPGMPGCSYATDCCQTHTLTLECLTDSLFGGDVVSVTVVLNGPVTPVLVTAAT